MLWTLKGKQKLFPKPLRYKQRITEYTVFYTRIVLLYKYESA